MCGNCQHLLSIILIGDPRMYVVAADVPYCAVLVGVPTALWELYLVVLGQVQLRSLRFARHRTIINSKIHKMSKIVIHLITGCFLLSHCKTASNM